MSALSLRSGTVNLYKFNQPEGRQCAGAGKPVPVCRSLLRGFCDLVLQVAGLMIAAELAQ
jgi:hypothetical protein